jgi:lysophospholipase L1-like esterase
MKLAVCFVWMFIALGAVAAIPAAEPEVPAAAFVKNSRILFQGDSITDMNRGRGTDPNHILGHSYVFLIASKYGAAFPDLNLDFVNRGISGNTVLDLEKRWQKDTLDLKPDLLSILIGVNDNKAVPVEQYEQVYDKLIADAKAANPKLKLVLGEPFGLPTGARKETWEAWNDGLTQRRAIVAKLAKAHGAALVKYQAAFDDAATRAPAEYWIWDGVHPTYRGQQVMAEAWVKTVREFWPETNK